VTTNLIDILNHGDLELFHSSVLSWFLTPNAPHGYGARFLRAFIKLAQSRSGMLGPENDGSLETAIVSTERKRGRRRVDILVETSGFSLAIENKYKTIGSADQLRHYRDDHSVDAVIGLGFTRDNFPSRVAQEFPVLTYTDVVGLLEELGAPETPDYQVLYRHYLEYLKRETDLAAGIREYAQGFVDTAAFSGHIRSIVEKRGLTENDKRFYNNVHLQSWVNWLRKEHPFGRLNWGTNKNLIGGAVAFTWGTDAWGSMYLQVELDPGVFAAAAERAGKLQLRTSKPPEADMKRVYEDCLAQVNLSSPGIQRAARPASRYNSCQVCFRELTLADIRGPQLADIMDNFVASIGLPAVGEQ